MTARAIILASASPRRLHLLSEAGWNVKVMPPSEEEVWPEQASVEDAVCELALHKARQISRDFLDTPVLGADTVVTLDGEVFGKPRSRALAHAMLRTLSGRTHEVLTGVALVLGAQYWTDFERSRVTFRALTEGAIEAYLDVAAYQDKAGAYGLQEDGGTLVEHWDGRFDNIVGLPLNTVESLWNRMEAQS